MPAQLQPRASQGNSIMSKPERSQHIPITDTVMLFLTLWRRPYHQHSNYWKLTGKTQGVTRNSYEIEVTGLSNPFNRIAKGSIFCCSEFSLLWMTVPLLQIQDSLPQAGPHQYSKTGVSALDREASALLSSWSTWSKYLMSSLICWHFALWPQGHAWHSQAAKRVHPTPFIPNT